MEKILLIAALFSGAVLSAQTVLEEWEFVETSSRHLGGVTNTGTIGSAWNSGTANKAQTTMPTTGFLDVYSKPDASWARYTTSSTVYSSGKFLLEMNLGSWDLTGHQTGANSGGTSNTTHKIELFASNGGTEVAGIKFRIQDTSAGGFTGIADKASIQFTGGASDSFTSDLGLVAASASTYAVEFDFTNNVINYLTDSAVVNSETFSALQFDRIDFKITSTGTGNVAWESGSQTAGGVLYDAIRLTAIPEPDTYALIGGIWTLSLVMIRRHRA